LRDTDQNAMQVYHLTEKDIRSYRIK